jgi:hypothetical protein
MVMTLPENLAIRLHAIAAQQQRSPEAVLDQLLTDYETRIQLPAKRKKGTFAALVQSALDTDIRSDKPVDTASRSREILSTEYVDYLIQGRRG